MSLPDAYHYRIMEAIKAALEDANSEVGLVWKIQKLSAHSGAKWLPGAYLSPVLGFDAPGYENVNDKVTVRTMAAIVNPGEMSLTSDMHVQMKVIQRVESIFRNRTGAAAPASLRALNAISPNPGWKVQITRIEPADRFASQAFALGYDVCATVLVTEVTLSRTLEDFSTLGA